MSTHNIRLRVFGGRRDRSKHKQVNKLDDESYLRLLLDTEWEHVERYTVDMYSQEMLAEDSNVNLLMLT